MDFVSTQGQEEQAPVMSRGASHTLAAICDVDRVRAREALTLASGDLDRAALILMNNMTGTATDSGDIMMSAAEMSPVQELAELGGMTHIQAQELLTSAGGDLERAKANYLLTSLGISEKFSCLLHPQALGTCPVCFDTPTSTEELVQLQQCSHQFCVDCLQGWIRSEAGSSSTGRIQCPQQGCGCFISHAELKELLLSQDSAEGAGAGAGAGAGEGEQLFRQLDRRALELLTASDSSLHLCPSPDCTYIVSWDPEELELTQEEGGQAQEPCATCPLCSLQRCLACGVSPYHHHFTCAEHLQSRREQREQREREQQDMGQTQQLQQKEDEEEAATLAFLQRSGFRVCRQCKGGVVKSGGCDKMKCRCGYRFCYQCDAENARCGCTPRAHGFWDNITGGGDFSNLK